MILAQRDGTCQRLSPGRFAVDTARTTHSKCDSKQKAMTSLTSLCTTLGTQWDHLLSLKLLHLLYSYSWLWLFFTAPKRHATNQYIFSRSKIRGNIFHLCVISRNKCGFSLFLSLHFVLGTKWAILLYIEITYKNSHLIEKVMMQHVGQSGLPAVLLLLCCWVQSENASVHYAGNSDEWTHEWFLTVCEWMNGCWYSHPVHCY